MIEDTKLQLAKTSRRSAVYSGVGLFVLIGSLIFSAAQLRSLSARRSQLLQEIQGLTAEKNKEQETLKKMKGDIAYYASQVTPSVDVYYANDGQRPKANEAAEQLKKLGYDVSVDAGPLKVISQNTYVRYFFTDDKELAEQVQQQIKSLGINAQVQSFAEEPDRKSLGYVRPKALELWLGKRYVPVS
jgi:ABC-type transport system substrate-binding protein